MPVKQRESGTGKPRKTGDKTDIAAAPALPAVPGAGAGASATRSQPHAPTNGHSRADKGLKAKDPAKPGPDETTQDARPVGAKKRLSGAARRRLAKEAAAKAASATPPTAAPEAVGAQVRVAPAALPVPKGRLIERLPREPGSKGGAPRFGITDAGLALVHNAMANGSAINAIPPRLGISQNAFKALRASDPRVNEAIDEGLAANETELVGILMTAARKGNIAAAIYLTKSIHGFTEGEARNVDGKLLGTIKLKLLPASLPAIDFDSKYNAEAEGPL